MVKFSYRAKKGVHEVVEDVVEAATLNEAVSKITQQGYLPIDLEVYEERKRKLPRPARSLPVPGLVRVPPKQTAIFTRQLYDLIDAGIPLLKALRLLGAQEGHAGMKKMLEEMAGAVQDGSSFSDALARHPGVFSPLYVNLVKSGEQSGQLNAVLGRLSDFLDKDQEVSSKVTASLVYPGLILSVGAVTVFVLLSFVIPRLTEMFDELSAQLPWPTVVLMAVSGFFSRWWWALLLLGGAGFFFLKEFEKKDDARVAMDRFKLRIPLIGEFILKMETVRFAQTLATLLEGGVSIVEALKGVSAVAMNSELRRQFERAAQEVSAGASLADSLKKIPLFPAGVVNMVLVGEESGHLEKALRKVASSYERQTDQIVKAMTSLLEPMLIVVVGAVIGFIVVAMLLPIFQMNLMVQ